MDGAADGGVAARERAERPILCVSVIAVSIARKGRFGRSWVQDGSEACGASMPWHARRPPMPWERVMQLESR